MDQNPFAYHPTPNELKPYLRQCVVCDIKQETEVKVEPRPSGYSYLHWLRGGKFDVFDTDRLTATYGAPTVFLAGGFEREQVSFAISGNSTDILCELTATGAYELVGIKGSDFKGRSISFSEMPTNAIKRFTKLIKLGEQTADASIDESLKLFQECLSGFARQPYEVPPYLAPAIAEIENKRGLVTIVDIANRVQVSQRQLNRVFNDYVGYSPKIFSRIIQVNCAMQAAMQEDREYFSQIAASAGYADESHFIRTAQELFKSSPLDFLQSEQETWFEYLRQSRSL